MKETKCKEPDGTCWEFKDVVTRTAHTVDQLTKENEKLKSRIEELEEQEKVQLKICEGIECGEFEAAMHEWKAKAEQALKDAP